MAGLIKKHADLKAALEPLGIEVGPETLGIWRDRELRGEQPLPTEALRRLAALAERLVNEWE